MPVPVIIIAGFLGGGKTTFLQRLLPLCGRAGIRPALVINEAGAVDVDGTLLAESRAEMVSILGGCICCTLQADLAVTVKALVERHAGDLLLIECSGLSAPRDVLAALATPDVSALVAITHVVCLVDTAKFQKLPAVVELVKAQIGAADLLILNKTDKLAPERREHVTQLLESLRAPDARVHWTTYGDIGTTALLALLTDPAPARHACDCHDHAHCQHGHSHPHTHALPAGITTVEIPLPDVVDRPTLDRLIAALPESVIRAKGFANVDGEGWVTIQRVFDTTDITPFNRETPPPTAALVCIGPGVEAAALHGLIEEAFGMRTVPFPCRQG